MIIPIVVNSPTPKEELVDIRRIFLGAVEFNMSAIVYLHNFDAINID